MKLTGFPRPVAREAYIQAIDGVVRVLRAQPAVRAIYQVGGIRSPGISDVDLLVVFHDDVDSTFDPLQGLSAGERYLFPHSQFGLPERFFPAAIRFGFFHDYQLLYGLPLEPAVDPLGPEELAVVNRQVGLEYLLKMYIGMCIERRYGIARVRNLLLLGRALRYDLEYVGATGGRLDELVEKVIAWREAWFTAPPPAGEVVGWFNAVHVELERLLVTLLERQPLFVPDCVNLRIARNQTLEPAGRLEWAHRGLTLPAGLGDLGRRYFNVQHRFNSFSFKVPITQSAPPVLKERHALIAAMLEYNDRHLPFYGPPGPALPIFRRSKP